MPKPADKGWSTLTIPAGSTESDPIPIPYDEISAPGGQVRAADGSRFKGRDRPKIDVEEVDEASCKIVLRQPADQDLLVRYKREDDDEAGN